MQSFKVTISQILLVLCVSITNSQAHTVYLKNKTQHLSDFTESTNNEELVYSHRERNYRKSKFFPLLTIIRFNNEICRTTAEETGLCFSRSQCVGQGGLAQGSCAQGLGVCCRFIAQCGGIIRYNATSFQNPNYPSKYTPTGGSDICQVRVRKQVNVCQLRLNFVAFDIDGPSANVATTGGTTALSTDSGICKTDSLAVTSSGSSIPSLCGNMNGQHIYVDYGSSDTLTMNLLLSSNANNKDRQWNIEVLMIPCNSRSRAPVGCLQYFTGVSGQVSSFNFQGGIHLANMDYSVCVRMEDGMRTIDWMACNPGDVKIMAGGTAGSATANPTCPTTNFNDYLIIMGGVNYPLIPATGTTPAGQSVTDRFCDISFASSSAFVRSTVRPFVLHFKTDSVEQASAASGAGATESSIGFCLRWQQNPPQ